MAEHHRTRSSTSCSIGARRRIRDVMLLILLSNASSVRRVPPDRFSGIEGGGTFPTREEAFTRGSVDVEQRSGGQDQEDRRHAQNHAMAFIQERGSSSLTSEGAEAEGIEGKVDDAGTATRSLPRPKQQAPGAAAAPAGTSSRGFSKGGIVELTGLDENRQLNGKHGTLISRSDKGWTVALKSGKTVDVREKKLFPVFKAANQQQMWKASEFLRSLKGTYNVYQDKEDTTTIGKVKVDGNGKCEVTGPKQYTEQLIVADDGAVTMSEEGWKIRSTTQPSPRELFWRRPGQHATPLWVKAEQDGRAQQGPPPGPRVEQGSRPGPRAKQGPRPPDPSQLKERMRVRVSGTGPINGKQGILVRRAPATKGSPKMWTVHLDQQVLNKHQWDIYETNLHPL